MYTKVHFRWIRKHIQVYIGGRGHLCDYAWVNFDTGDTALLKINTGDTKKFGYPCKVASMPGAASGKEGVERQIMH